MLISDRLPTIGLPMNAVPQTTVSFEIIFATNVVAMNFNGLYLYMPKGIKIILSGMGVTLAINITSQPYFLIILKVSG